MKETYQEAIHTYTPINKRGQYGMSSRPAYYSGRGVNEGDLNAGHLERIYKGLLRDFGSDQADAFVLLVKSIPVLSATDFLIAFESFWHNGLVFSEPEPSNGIALDGYGDQLEAVAFATIMSAFGMPQSREQAEHRSDQIRDDFLEKIGMSVERRSRRSIYG